MDCRKCFAPLVGMALLGAAIAIAAWPEKSDRSPVVSETVVKVRQVESSVTYKTVRFSGVVRPAQQASLSFVLNGRIAERQVDVGDRVIRGQILAVLDTSECRLAERAAETAVRELEIQLEQANRDRIRTEHLHAEEAATDEELEKTRAAADRLKAALAAAHVDHDRARRLIRESRLVAPFAATVVAASLDSGEWASAGMPVVELVGEKDFEIEIGVPESIAVLLREGEDVVVELPLLGVSTTGTLRSSARAAVGMGRLFPAVVSICEDDRIVAGATAEVVFELRQDASVAVPLNAVINPGSSRPSVFRIIGNRAEEVAVEIGEIRGAEVRIRDGLDAGDVIVVSGQTGLADGEIIEVL